MAQRPESGPEQPRAEPEIIPPGDPRIRSQWRTSFDDPGRIYVARVGPLGFATLAFAIGAIAAFILLLLIGAFLIAVPFAGLLLVVAVLISLLRGPFRRLR
jgi:hypothetical protein